MVAPSSLSVICEHIRQFLRTELNAAASSIEISIGAPAAQSDDTHNCINLFFYRYEPSGFEAGPHPDVPWRIRMFLMVTPFGINEAAAGSTVPAGENDLRLLGEVMRVFHENPVLPSATADGFIVRAQAMFLNTTDEQISQIWSTQGDVHYRPSVVYEFSLVPIVPEELAPPRPLTGTFGVEVRPDAAITAAPFAGIITGPPVPRTLVDTRDPEWTPALAWVIGDTLFRSLSPDVDAPDFAAFAPAVWIAGDPAATVTLEWQAWRPTGWAPAGAPMNVSPHSVQLDPDRVPPASASFPTATPLPEALGAAATSQQFLLAARRTHVRIDGSSVDLVSQPLLVTLWRDAP